MASQSLNELKAPTVIPLIDIGVNLTDPMFQGVYRDKARHAPDLDLVLQRAAHFNVQAMIVTAGSLSESKNALALANQHSNLFSTVGVHPTRCDEFDAYPDGPDAYYDSLLNVLHEGKNKIVAVGECGLDFDRLHFCEKETQLKYFETQFKLAEASGLPLFLHNRNTGGKFFEMMAAHRSRFKYGVVHSFTGDLAELEQLLSLDLFIGVNGCSLKTEESLSVVKQIPLDRLLIETDAPWCGMKRTHASHALRTTIFPNGKKEKAYDPKTDSQGVKDRCEPMHLVSVLEVIAAVKGLDIDECAAAVLANTRVVFPTVLPLASIDDCKH